MKENDNGCFTTISGHFFGNYMTIFHKTEVQTVILRCLTGLNHDWFKSWLKMQIFLFPFFCNIVEKNGFAFFAFFFFFTFCVITVVPIMIKTCSAPQNDRLNFSFVKDFHIVGTNMARNCRKMAIYQMQIWVINLWFGQNRVWPQDTFCVMDFEPFKILIL